MNIFDLKNLTDIPASVKVELQPLGLRNDTLKMLELFEIKSHLSIDEIIIGLYRKFSISRSRPWVSSTIYNLKSRNLIKLVTGKIKVYERNYISEEKS